MIDGLVKIAGSLFVGGIGLAIILLCSVIGFVLIKELIEYMKER